MSAGKVETRIHDEITQASKEIQAIIRRHYPESKFRLLPGIEADMWQLNAYVSNSEEYDVLDLVGDKLTDLLVERDIAIYVVPLPLSIYEATASG